MERLQHIYEKMLKTYVKQQNSSNNAMKVIAIPEIFEVQPFPKSFCLQFFIANNRFLQVVTQMEVSILQSSEHFIMITYIFDQILVSQIVIIVLIYHSVHIQDGCALVNVLLGCNTFLCKKNPEFIKGTKCCLLERPHCGLSFYLRDINIRCCCKRNKLLTLNITKNNKLVYTRIPL